MAIRLRNSKTNPPRRGFSLVEVTAALGIITTTLFLLVGLVPTGVQSNSDTYDETQATNLASLIIADMRGCGPTGTSPLFNLGINTMRNTPTGSFTRYFSETFDSSATLDGHASGVGSRYRADVAYKTQSKIPVSPMEVNLTISWPAQLDPTSVALNGQYNLFFTVPHPDAFE